MQKLILSSLLHLKKFMTFEITINVTLTMISGLNDRNKKYLPLTTAILSMGKEVIKSM